METDSQAKQPAIAPAARAEATPQRVIQPVPLVIQVPANDLESRLQHMEIALAKATQLLERHLAAGHKTVPIRALYFILRDAGYGTSAQKQTVKPTPKQEQEVTNQLHHTYGMRR